MLDACSVCKEAAGSGRALPVFVFLRLSRLSALTAPTVARKRTLRIAIPAILSPDAPGGEVTDHKGVATGTADPSPHSDTQPKRPWWRSRAIAALGAVVAAVAVGGYFGINAVLAHPSSSATAPPASGVDDQVPGLPPGASDCKSIHTDVGPFNAGARGTPLTSCEFVEQVSMAYSRHTPTSGPDLLTVLSPKTSVPYRLVCLSMRSYATCTGGAAAVIYLYNK